MDVKIKKIRDIVCEADAMRRAFYFSPPLHASDRRKYEQLHSHGEIAWSEGGHTYTASYYVCCSSKNVYAKGRYTKDGKTTTLTSIKNSLSRLEEEEK